MLDKDYPYTSGKTERIGRCKYDRNKIAMKVSTFGDVSGTVKSIHQKLSE